MVPPSPITPRNPASKATATVRRSMRRHSPKTASAGTTPYSPHTKRDCALPSTRKFVRLLCGMNAWCKPAPAHNQNGAMTTTPAIRQVATAMTARRRRRPRASRSASTSSTVDRLASSAGGMNSSGVAWWAANAIPARPAIRPSAKRPPRSTNRTHSATRNSVSVSDTAVGSWPYAYPASATPGRTTATTAAALAAAGGTKIFAKLKTATGSAISVARSRVAKAPS